MSTSLPSAGSIDIPDAPKISNVDLLGQVIRNITGQLTSFDSELSRSSRSQNASMELLALCDGVSDIQSRITHLAGLIESTKKDEGVLAAVNKGMERDSDTRRKFEKLVKSVKAMEEEMVQQEYDSFYFETMSVHLSDVQKLDTDLDAYSGIPHLTLIRSKIDGIQ